MAVPVVKGEQRRDRQKDAILVASDCGDPGRCAQCRRDDEA